MIASFASDIHPVCSLSVRYADVDADQAKTYLTYLHKALDVSSLKTVGVCCSIIVRKSCLGHRVSMTFPIFYIPLGLLYRQLVHTQSLSI